ECSPMACSVCEPMTRAPNVPVAATISVPGDAATLAAAASFSVTMSDVFALTTRMRMAAPRATRSGEHRGEVDVAAPCTLEVERALYVGEVLDHQRGRPLAVAGLDRVGDRRVLVKRARRNIRRVVED